MFLEGSCASDFREQAISENRPLLRPRAGISKVAASAKKLKKQSTIRGFIVDNRHIDLRDAVVASVAAAVHLASRGPTMISYT
jgi:hypothetical protein